jgi:ring-1,2-phenylacetyl-CoA epoxidase subunit PaaD
MQSSSLTIEKIYDYLQEVSDPEVPVLNVLDLGVVRKVEIVSDTEVLIQITPTYSGCPAMDVIGQTIKFALHSYGIEKVTIQLVLSPAWTTDWMSESGKQKLKEYGIAPPQYTSKENPENRNVVPCPRCESQDTEVLSEFGSTACKSMYRCKSCLEPFDYFKCH